MNWDTSKLEYERRYPQQCLFAIRCTSIVVLREGRRGAGWMRPDADS
jgi:hypothetical protein